MCRIRVWKNPWVGALLGACDYCCHKASVRQAPVGRGLAGGFEGNKMK